MKKHLTLFAAILLAAFSSYGQGLFNNGQQPVSSSSPDGYGYTWVYDPSLYDWVDIETIGTKVTGLTDDNFVGPIDMGMNFQFYWETKTKLYIGSNGYLAFRPINIASNADGFPNTPISTDEFSDFIAPMMCDMKLDGLGNQSKAYYYHDAANNRFIVSFINVAFWKNAATPYSGSNTFQVILNGNDSSIVFNYKAQSGSWDTNYDADPFPMIVGIENSTGQYGIGISPTETNGKYKPKFQDCLIFRQPATALVTVKDAGPVSVQNTMSEGVFMVAQRESTDPNNPPMYDLTAAVGNLGNSKLNDQVTVVATVSDTSDFAYVTDTLRIDSMLRNEVKNITFPSVYTPQYIDATPNYHFNYSVQTLMGTDANADNDKINIELVALDTTGGVAYMDYASNNTVHATDAINWTGGAGNSGAGIFIQPFGYPVTVNTVDIMPLFNSTVVDNNPIAYYVEVWSANSDGSLGDMLQRDTVMFADIAALQDPTTLWVTKELTTPVQIDSNGFFISYIQQRENVFVAAESRLPISRRTYEILDGSWAPYRNRNSTDVWLRATVDVSKVWKTGVEQFVPVENLVLAPNPARNQVNLSFDMTTPSDVRIRITDMQGRKVFMTSVEGQANFSQTIEFGDLPAGIYSVELLTAKGSIARKLVIE